MWHRGEATTLKSPCPTWRFISLSLGIQLSTSVLLGVAGNGSSIRVPDIRWEICISSCFANKMEIKKKSLKGLLGC